MKTVKAPRLVRDWAGMYVRSRYEVANGWGTLPAGTLFKIKYGTRNKHLVSQPCSHCGFSLLVMCGGTRANFVRDFDFVDPGAAGW